MTWTPSRKHFLAILPLSLLYVSCGKPDVQIFLKDRNGLRSQAKWLEFNVFPSGCPAKEDIAYRKYSGALHTEVLEATGELGAVGDLPAENLGFCAILRDENCATIAFGCTPADLKSIRSVTVNVQGVYSADGKLSPVGPCEAGLTCNRGVCTDGTGGTGGTGGAGGTAGSGGTAGTGGTAGSGGTGGGNAGCDLTLVKAAALPDPIGDGATVSGPAVVATDTGFIIGYREVTAAGDAGRVVLFPMNKEGANGPPVYQATAECPGAAITDSVAMAIHPEAAPPYMGMVAVTRPPCPTDATNPNQPMLTLVRFKKSGGLLDNGASDPAAFSFFGATGDPAGSIASPHGLARKPGSAQFNLTYSQGGSGKTWYVTTPQTITSVPFPFPDTGVTSSITASSADLLLEAAVVSDGGAGNKVVVRTTPTTGTATSTDRASAAAIAAAVTGSRGIIASRSSVGGVSWAVVDATGADIAAGTLSNSPPHKDGFDVTTLGTNLLLAQGAASSIDLFRIANVNATPETDPSRTVSLTSSDAPSLASFDGNQVAIAAVGDRVIVTWVSRKQLVAGDPTGGYAVYACQ